MEFIRGRILMGAVSLAIWLALFVVISRLLHRRGIARLSVSITTTALFIAMAAAVIVGL